MLFELDNGLEELEAAAKLSDELIFLLVLVWLLSWLVELETAVALELGTC